MSYAAPQYALPTPQVLGITCPWCALGGFLSSSTTGAPASATGPAANQAIFVPFVVTDPYVAHRGWWWNGSVATNAGNVSVGIYDASGTRLATTGSVAASGNSVIQTAAFTADVTLYPGQVYYMAIEFSASGLNSTTAYASNLTMRMAGLLTQAVGANPLPANATFATWSSQVVPEFGIGSTSFAI